jgi:hypothetical protein
MHGIEALLKSIESEPRDSEKRFKLEEKIAGYMRRAESLKDRISRDQRIAGPGETKRRHQTTIAIAEDAAGFRFLCVA